MERQYKNSMHDINKLQVSSAYYVALGFDHRLKMQLIMFLLLINMINVDNIFYYIFYVQYELSIKLNFLYSAMYRYVVNASFSD
jgi:hypothetical protein